jgi:hypothetical protein
MSHLNVYENELLAIQARGDKDAELKFWREKFSAYCEEYQLDFWEKLIAGEVERLRFNDGLEPLDVDLYPIRKPGKNTPHFCGETLVGRRKFRALAFKLRDKDGNSVLRVQITPEPKA